MQCLIDISKFQILIWPQHGTVKANCRVRTPFKINSRVEKQSHKWRKLEMAYFEKRRTFVFSLTVQRWRKRKKINSKYVAWNCVYHCAFGERYAKEGHCGNRYSWWIYLKQWNVLFRLKDVFVVKLLRWLLHIHHYFTHVHMSLRI